MPSGQIKPQYRGRKKNYKNVSVIEPKECSSCNSKNIIKWGWRYNHTIKKQRYKCKSCSQLFTVNDGFFKIKHKRDVITACLNLYMNGLSLRKCVEHFNLGKNRWLDLIYKAKHKY